MVKIKSKKHQMIELSSENLQSMSTAETEAKREINVKEI